MYKKLCLIYCFSILFTYYPI